MKIQFSTEGAAFRDEYESSTMNDIYTREEVSRILKKIASLVESGISYGSVMDINGNKIGEWSI